MNLKKIYYYQCSKLPKCKGKAKFNKINIKFYITQECKDINTHNKLSYEKLSEFIDKNKLNLIDFNNKKIKQI